MSQDVPGNTIGLEYAVLGVDSVAVIGTGEYIKKVGTRRPHDCFFSLSLNYNRAYVVDDPTEMTECKGCEAKDICPYAIVLVEPIVQNGEVLGVAGVLGQSVQNNQIVSEKIEQWRSYLQKLSYFYSQDSYISSILTARKLADEKLSQAFHLGPRQGLIIADSNMRIIRTNHTANQILGCGSGEVMFDRPLEQFWGPEVLNRLNHSEFTKLNMDVSYQDKLLALGVTNAKELKLQQAYAIVMEEVPGSRPVQRRPQGQSPVLNKIVGDTPAIHRAKSTIERISASSMPVLIQGESGTGKELVAEAIHQLSSRARKNMVSLNCAALPETLVESELFGYEQGAFTGSASGGKKGKFELAEGGTLFLDEIGDLSLAAQAKLLRAIEQQEFYRLGGQRAVKVDVRIVAATNAPLEALIKQNKFREDLFYRLNVIPIQMEPLRNRAEDIELLARHFLAQHHLLRQGSPGTSFSGEVLDIFRAYTWPGNIRQLKNVVEYMVVMSTTSEMGADCLPDFMLPAAPPQPPADAGMKKCGPEELRAALQKHGRSTEGKKQAAKALGISLATLYRMMKREE